MEKHFVDVPLEEWQSRDLWSLEEFVWLCYGFASVVEPDDPTTAYPDDMQKMVWLRERLLRAVQAGNIQAKKNDDQLPHRILAPPKAWIDWSKKNGTTVPAWMLEMFPTRARGQRSRQPKVERARLDVEIQHFLDNHRGKTDADIARLMTLKKKTHGYSEGATRKYIGELRKKDR